MSTFGDSPIHTPEELYSGYQEMPLAVDRPAEQVTTVEIRGQPYRVPLGPDSIASKQFYRDLTWMGDEELIFTYNLTRYTPMKSTSTQTPTSANKRISRASKYTSRLLG